MAHGSQPHLREAILQLKAGDCKSVKQVYDLTATRIYGKLLSLLKSPKSASEALRNTYLNLWRERASIPSSHDNYLFFIAAIAHRAAVEIRFRSQMSGKWSEELDGGKSSFHGSRETLALNTLDDADRAMLTSAYLQFDSVEDIAARHGLSAAEVRQRLAKLTSRGGMHDE